MKKLLLIVMATAITTAQAQILGNQKWSQELTTVEAATDLYLGAPVTITAEGNVIATGTFNQSLTIGETTLEPVATSAYIAKYDAEGKAAWAVALQGSATIKAIDTDADGNIYVAGQFADVVTVGSTDGNTQTITGVADVTAQVAAFVAKYDANGNLKTVKTINAEGDAQMLEDAANWVIMYFPETFPFTIGKLVVEGGKVYISASHMGNVTVDNVAWKGTYATIWGMLFDITSMGIIAMDAENLANAESVAHIESYFDAEDLQYYPEDLNFAVEGSTVYAAFVGFGKQQMTTAAGVSKYEFATTEEGASEHGYVLAKIEGATTTDKQFTAVANDIVASHNLINRMEIAGDNIMFAGTFIGTLPFNNDVVSKGLCDVFAATVAKSDFTVGYTVASGVEENIDADGNSSMSIYEVVGGMVINNGTAYISSYVYNSGDDTVSAPATYNVSTTGEISAGEKKLFTSMAANESLIVTLQNDTRKEPASTTISVYEVAEVETSIAPVIGNDNSKAVIYDLTGRKIDTVSTPGIYIINGKKVVIK